jgi:hypothetical protein
MPLETVAFFSLRIFNTEKEVGFAADIIHRVIEIIFFEPATVLLLSFRCVALFKVL